MTEWNAANSKNFEVGAILDNAVFVKEPKSHLLKLYYLVVWKSYFEEENTWESVLVV